MERLSIYDGKGKIDFNYSVKTDFEKIIGNLDLETIREQL